MIAFILGFLVGLGGAATIFGVACWWQYRIDQQYLPPTWGDQ